MNTASAGALMVAFFTLTGWSHGHSLEPPTSPSAAAADPSPPLPYGDPGTCPFECCMYREWSAKQATQAFKKRDRSSVVLFELRPAEKVQALTGVVITHRPGVVRVRSDHTFGSNPGAVRIRGGSTVYVLHYLGEGYYRLWYRGEVFDGPLPDRAEGNPGQVDQEVVFESQSESVWWVRVRNAAGLTGWTDQPDHFKGSDACD